MDLYIDIKKVVLGIPVYKCIKDSQKSIQFIIQKILEGSTALSWSSETSIKIR